MEHENLGGICHNNVYHTRGGDCILGGMFQTPLQPLKFCLTQFMTIDLVAGAIFPSEEIMFKLIPQ